MNKTTASKILKRQVFVHENISFSTADDRCVGAFQLGGGGGQHFAMRYRRRLIKELLNHG